MPPPIPVTAVNAEVAQAIVEVYNSEATWSLLSSAGRQLLANAMGYETARETVRGSLGV